MIIPQEDKDDEVCNTQDTLERGLKNSLPERFSCADSAQSCRDALFELVGYSVDTETTEQILEGTFTPPGH